MEVRRLIAKPRLSAICTPVAVMRSDASGQLSRQAPDQLGPVTFAYSVGMTFLYMTKKLHEQLGLVQRFPSVRQIVEWYEGFRNNRRSDRHT